MVMWSFYVCICSYFNAWHMYIWQYTHMPFSQCITVVTRTNHVCVCVVACVCICTYVTHVYVQWNVCDD